MKHLHNLAVYAEIPLIPKVRGVCECGQFQKLAYTVEAAGIYKWKVEAYRGIYNRGINNRGIYK